MSDLANGSEDVQATETETERTSQEATSQEDKGQGSGSQAQANTNNQTSNNTQQQANQPDPQIKELRREAANYRTQLKEAQTQLEQATSQRSQIEAERDALRSELRELKVGAAIREVVSMAQPIEIEPVLAILGNGFKVDGRTGEVDRDAIGEAVAQVQTKYPFLFKGANLGADAGAGGGSYAATDMNRALRQAAGFSS